MVNKIMLIFLLFILNNKAKEKNLNTEEELIKVEKSLIETERNKFTLNIPNTKNKIKIMKKIGSYFPPEYISPINKSIIITEKILKGYETLDFIENSQINYIESSIPMKDNKERFNYIINTIKNEVSKEEIKDMGMLLDIIINMDKYKAMFTMLNSFMSDSDSLNDPNKIFQIMEPLVEGKSEEEKKKMKEMMKMLEIMKTLDKK